MLLKQFIIRELDLDREVKDEEIWSDKTFTWFVQEESGRGAIFFLVTVQLIILL